MTPETPQPFPSTAWSMIHAAKNLQDSHYMEAVNRFITSYSKPVFYFLRTRGYPVHEAEDLTQEFFLTILERGWLTGVDAERGRFRTFLLTVLVRFLSDRGQMRAPKQQVFDQQLVSISSLVSEKDRSFEPSDDQTAEQVFMKQWAKAVIADVCRRVEAWCRDHQRLEWYIVFTEVHFPAAGARRPSQEAIANRLGQSRDQVRYALEQTNQKFAKFLREAIADQVSTPDDIDSEIHELELLLV